MATGKRPQEDRLWPKRKCGVVGKWLPQGGAEGSRGWGWGALLPGAEHLNPSMWLTLIQANIWIIGTFPHLK